MPLPPVEYPRTPMHTRTVRVDAYRRDDGRWDLEAELVDIKPHDVPLQSGVRKGGDAMHTMRLRVTVDDHFNIVEAVAVSDSVPYPGYCEAIVGDYDKLVGLNLVRGFRAGLRERLGERNGCTHLTELAQSLPTAAVQAFAGDPRRQQEMERQANGQGQRPFQIDRCHALRSNGPAVQLYYPAWYRSEARERSAGARFGDVRPRDTRPGSAGTGSAGTDSAGQRDADPPATCIPADSAASKEEQP